MLFTCLAYHPSENNSFPNIFSPLRLPTPVVECDYCVSLPNLYLWCTDWLKDSHSIQIGS